MTISHLSLVNQKLAYANALIHRLSAESNAGYQRSPRLEFRALADAAVFHLATALHFYLRELAEQQGLKNLNSISSIDELISVLQQADRLSSEAIEIDALKRTASSWLAQLLQYYDQLKRSPEKPKEKKSFGQENLIELTELDAEVAIDPTAELLGAWLEAFRKMIARQRETSAEY